MESTSNLTRKSPLTIVLLTNADKHIVKLNAHTHELMSLTNPLPMMEVEVVFPYSPNLQPEALLDYLSVPDNWLSRDVCYCEVRGTKWDMKPEYFAFVAKITAGLERLSEEADEEAERANAE